MTLGRGLEGLEGLALAFSTRPSFKKSFSTLLNTAFFEPFALTLLRFPAFSNYLNIGIDFPKVSILFNITSILSSALLTLAYEALPNNLFNIILGVKSNKSKNLTSTLPSNFSFQASMFS